MVIAVVTDIHNISIVTWTNRMDRIYARHGRSVYKLCGALYERTTTFRAAWRHDKNRRHHPEMGIASTCLPKVQSQTLNHFALPFSFTYVGGTPTLLFRSKGLIRRKTAYPATSTKDWMISCPSSSLKIIIDIVQSRPSVGRHKTLHCTSKVSDSSATW